MLRRVRARNFKAIGDTGIDMELLPLTLLVGENGSGKSSILEAIGVFAQSALPSNRIGWVTDGPLLTITEEVARHGRSEMAPLEVALWADIDGPGTRGTVAGYGATSRS
jgi:energy-coupling factor transporter ATP-binding protein EcfA2